MTNPRKNIIIFIAVIAVIILLVGLGFYYKNPSSNPSPSNNEPAASQQATNQDNIIAPGLIGNDGQKRFNIDLSDDPMKLSTACSKDSDCSSRLDTCNCKVVCRNVNYDYFDNCRKACTVQEMNFDEQFCSCKDNKCFGQP